jgi:hypothetical protein
VVRLSEGREPLSREDLLALAESAAQKGSVAAIKLLLEELRRDSEPDAGGSEFDELDNVTPFRKKSA